MWSWASESLRRVRPIGPLTAAFVLVAGLYSLATPVFEAPDEIQHFYYVKYIVEERRLPVQGPEGWNTWAQEGNQPPLYYVLAAPLAAPVDLSDTDEVLWLNPQANVGNPLQPGNKNRVVHRDEERFPYRGTVLAVHLIRLLSVALGAGTVYFTYLLARELLPGRRSLSLVAAALVGFNPQFCFISGAVSNDNLVTFLAAISLFLSVRYLLGRLGRRGVALWGLVLGLAALSKVSGLLLLAVALGAILAAAWSRRSPLPSLLADAGLLLGLWALVAGWWYLRNWFLYGEPTGTSAMIAVAGERTTPVSWPAFLHELRGLRISYWGVLGWFNILAWPWLYRVADALGLLALAGLLLGAWWSRRRLLNDARPLAALALVAWAALMAVSLLFWTTQTFGSQGRLLFPASPALAVLSVLGWSHLPVVGRRGWAFGLLAAGLAVLAVATPFVYIRPAYARPPILTEAEVPPEARIAPPLDHAERIRLLGREVRPSEVHPGDWVEVVLYWQCLQPMDYDYNLFIRLLGYREEVIAQVDSYPGAGTYPTSLWQPGQVIRDRYRVQVSPIARVPVVAKVDIGFYDRWSMAGLPSHDPQGQPMSGVIGTVKVTPNRTEPAPEPTYLLGGAIGLAQYEVSDTTLTPGGQLFVSLTWQSVRPVQEDYTVFLHLEGPKGVVAQNDRPPLSGYYPTSAWSPGDLVPDRVRLLVGARVPEGTYRLVAGLYRLQDGARLPVTAPDGTPVGDHIPLGEIRIVRKP